MGNRRSFLNAAASSGLGFLVTTHGSDCFAEPASYKWSLLRNNVGFFNEKGGTVGWLISSDGVVVVDTEVEESAHHLLSAIRRETNRKIDLIINTHHHATHSYGNIVFKGKTAMLLAHENSRKNKELDYQRAGLRQRVFSLPEQYYPDITMTHEWSKSFGNEKITVKYFGAAHTDGDVAVHFQNANVVHLGDLLYHRTPPLIDMKNGASFLSWIAALEKIRAHYDKDSKFICGHADNGLEPVCSLADIKAFEDFMHRTRDAVSAALKLGHRQAQIVNMQTIPGAEEWRSVMLKSTLTAAYLDLTKK